VSDQDELGRLIHDIRTPLTVVDGFAQLLERDVASSPEDRADYLRRIREGAHDIRRLLDEADARRRTADAG
jgi:signal transduction histidine kinase